jgi:hypothetical protein
MRELASSLDIGRLGYLGPDHHHPDNAIGLGETTSLVEGDWRRQYYTSSIVQRKLGTRK